MIPGVWLSEARQSVAAICAKGLGVLWVAALLAWPMTAQAGEGELAEAGVKGAPARCDALAASRLSLAEEAIEQGGQPSRQSGWTNAHIDLMLTDALLIAEVGREYAAARCWDDVARLTTSGAAADETLARVAYLLGEAGDFARADAAVAAITSPWVRRDAMSYFVGQAVRAGDIERALGYSLARDPQADSLESPWSPLLAALAQQGRNEKIKELAGRHGERFTAPDWVRVARAEAETGNVAHARGLVRRSLRSAAAAERDTLRLFASALAARYFPDDALANFRSTRNRPVRETIFKVSLAHAETEKVRSRFIAEAQRQFARNFVACTVAVHDARRGEYEAAYASLQRHRCRSADPAVAETKHRAILIRSMVRRGDIDRALDWFRRAPAAGGASSLDVVVWGLAGAGRSGEALVFLDAAAGRTLPPVLLPAVAAVLPADAPYEAWLDLALRAAAPGNGREPAMQALAAAFARAQGADAVLAWLPAQLSGFTRARVLVGLVEGSRGVIPGQVRPSYWDLRLSDD